MNQDGIPLSIITLTNSTTKIRCYSLLLLLLCFLPTHAQDNDLEAVKFHYEQHNYKKAKVLIDEAVMIPAKANYADVWYYKGAIYEALLMEYKKKYGELHDEFFYASIAAYQKAKETRDFGNVYAHTSQKRMTGLFTACINDGLNAYRRKDYQIALVLFEKALTIRPQDTTTLNYAQSAAMAKFNIEKANYYTNQLLNLSYQNNHCYEVYCEWLNKQNKATWVDFEIIKQIRLLFPQNKTFLSYETDFLLRFAKPEMALANIKVLLRAYPDYIPLWLNAGIISEVSGDLAAAEDSYKKVLELDSLNIEGHYSLGAYYYNLGIKKFQNAKYDEANELLLDDHHHICHLFQMAIPYLEKAHQAQPQNIATQKALCAMYAFLKREVVLCKD